MRKVHRPHGVACRLTSEQFELLKTKMIRDGQGLTIQKLLVAAVNAYIRGDFEVHPDGSYTLGEAAIITFGDDADGLDLDDLEDDGPDPDLEVWGTAELVKHAEITTGRRVNRQLLRHLLRERFPQEDGPSGPTGKRYRWKVGDPQIHEITDAIAAGALDELRERRIRAYRQE